MAPNSWLVRRLRSLTSVRNLWFLANFGVAKIATYLMPLVLASIATAQLYGKVELSLAIGLQSCALIVGASLAGVTQVYLVRGERQVGDILVFLTFATTCALSMAIMLAWALGASWPLLLVISVLSTTVIQNTAATWFRMRGERSRTAWTDGASLLISGLVVIPAVLIAGDEGIELATMAFTALTVLLAIASGVALLRNRNPDLFARLRRISWIGLPMMVAGLFAIWLGVGGRILVGITSPHALAAYSIAFRISGLALGVQQLAATAVFPVLYGARTRRGDRIASYFLGAVLAVLIFVALAGPYLPDFFHFSALRPGDVDTFRVLVPITAFQTFFWIGFALLQLRINRSGSAKALIMPILIVTVAGIGAILVLARVVSSDVRFIAVLIAIHAAAYFAAAWLVLAGRRLPHRSMGAIGVAGGLILGLIAAVSLIR